MVAVDSSHMTASSSASWNSFSPPSNFVSAGTCRPGGSWSVAGHNHKMVIGQDPICADFHSVAASGIKPLSDMLLKV